MNYNLKRPCDDCPFLKEGGIRLTVGAIQEIGGAMLNPSGSTFACHKTVEWDADGAEEINKHKQQHCAGALIFAEKNGNATQPMRWMERIGVYNASALMADGKITRLVFDNLTQMKRKAIR